MYATTHRRLLAALLALMLLAFCGCGKKEGTPSNSGQTASNWKKVLADYEDWADSYLALAENMPKILPMLLCFPNIPKWPKKLWIGLKKSNLWKESFPPRKLRNLPKKPRVSLPNWPKPGSDSIL